MKLQNPDLALLGPLAVAAMVGVWSTSTATACAVPFSHLVGTGAIGILAIVAGTTGERRIHDVLLTSGLGILSVLPVLRRLVTGGMPYGHDLSPHAWAVHSTARGLAAGEWWPRWHDAVGIGMPVGQFYPPVTYLLGGLFRLTGLAPVDAMTALVWVSGVAMAAAAWLGSRWLQWPRAAGALAAAAGILAPYRLLDASYRYALGELFAMPLLLLLIVLVVAKDRVRWVPIAVVSCLLLLTHPLSAVLAAVALLPVAALDPDPRHRLPRIVAAGLIGVLLSGAHTVPMAVESAETTVADVIPGSAGAFASHALELPQVAARDGWHGVRLSLTLTQAADKRAAGEAPREMPLYLGVFLVAAVLVTLWRGGRTERLVAGVALWCWLAATPAGAWVVGLLPPARTLQFPWRFLSPMTAAAVLCFGMWLARAHPGVRAVALGALLWDAEPGLGGMAWLDWPTDGDVHHWVVKRRSPTCEVRVLGWHPEPWQPPLQRVGSPVGDGAPKTDGAPWAGYPRGDLVHRVTDLLLPPNDLRTQVGSVYRAQPEFFTRRTANRFRQGVAAGDLRALADAGVRHRFGAPSTGDPDWPQVRLAVDGEVWGLAATVRRPRPSEIAIDLPETHPAGKLVFVEQAFPGWQVQVDETEWAPVPETSGLLTTPVAEGARTVRFRYTQATWPRRLGQLASLLGALLLAAVWRRA
jgi:hypothetical protein